MKGPREILEMTGMPLFHKNEIIVDFFILGLYYLVFLLYLSYYKWEGYTSSR